MRASPPPPPESPQNSELKCADKNPKGDYVLPSYRNPDADRWGDISIAQPKIWQFERVSALLDGLLRDVEGVSLADLNQLDPSLQNAAALKFIQSALEVGVQYDQAAAVNNANTLNSYNELHASQSQQLQQYNTYMQTLTNERDRLAAQYTASSNEVTALTALQASGPLAPAQTKQLEEATSKQASTQASLASVNSLISGAGAAPTLTAPPTVTGASVQGPASGSSMASSLSGFSDVLKNLPDGVQKNLSAALQSPSYPATKRLDNFITLLYERLAREISVLQDDLTRDPENVPFLLQFDVGVYPSKKAKDHVARVEFKLDCPGCKVYSLYPGQSSYNLANYSGASKRTTLWGNVLTLFGFGLSASYRRQTDTLEGSLVQSVYTAGFQNGVLNQAGNAPIDTREQVDADRAEQSFGWYYGAAPFEQLVTPGIRTTFAMITVPRELIRTSQDRFGNTDACMPFHIDAGWSNRNDPLAQNNYFSPVGKIVKQVRVPFYNPTRTVLDSYTESVADKRCDGGSNATCDPINLGEADSHTDPQLKKCCTIRTETEKENRTLLKAKTSVKLPASLDDYSLIGAREKQKLHVIRMEYDTVYEDPAAATSATSVQTMVQTSTQSTNPTTGQTTGQTTTQTTGSSVAVSNSSPGPAAPDASAALNPLSCPKLKCAPVLLKLDHPIDPNLTVTVRGNPLQRVRDWRGRATSVLPAAQSGSDLTGAAAASGSLSLKQLAQSRGLLEIDQFAPNTWFPLNSHELLLNISIDVARDYEFPVIQLVDPSGSVVIPHDLRKSFTELIVNNFRMRPETEHGIQTEVARQNWRDTDPDSDCPNDAEKPSCVEPRKDSPISTGMYPFSTYSPLFSSQPAPRKFFAVIGETGEDLLIGFLPSPPSKKGTDVTFHYDWKSVQTRVILEDRDQDFAWSLSCDTQGDLLACRIPNDEITRTYLNFLRACPTFKVCPGLESDYRPLLQSAAEKAYSLNTSVSSITPEQQPSAQPALFVHGTELAGTLQSSHGPDGLGNASVVSVNAAFPPTGFHPTINSLETNPSQAVAAEDVKEELKELQKRIQKLLSDNERNNLKDLPTAFLSTMQVWVEQFDEEGADVFYSPEPVHIGFFPISDDYWKNAHFKPWDFEIANADSLTLKECNYLPNNNQDELSVSLLGVPSWSTWLKGHSFSIPKQPEWTHLVVVPDTSGLCGSFEIPTAALVNNPIVFQMQFPVSRAVPDGNRVRAMITIPKSRVAPYFPQSEIRVYRGVELSAGTEKVAADKNVWRVVLPVEHSTCFDNLDFDPQLLKSSKIRIEWRNGNNALSTCSEKAALDNPQYVAWQHADQTGRVAVSIELPRPAIKDLPETIHLIRTTSDRVSWEVATLPNLRQLLLPSHATLKTLGTTEFAIVGEHAEVIDHVAVQNTDDGTIADADTIPGLDYAIVAFQASSSDANAKPDTSGDSAGGTNSMNIKITTTKDPAATVTLTQSSSSSAKPAAAPAKAGALGAAATPPPEAKTPPAADSKSAPAKLTPGTYAVVSLMQVGVGPASPEKIQAKVKAEQEAHSAIAKANAAIKQADASAAKAQSAAKNGAGKPPAAPAPDPSRAPGTAPPVATPPENKAKPATGEKQATTPPQKGGAAGPNAGGPAQPQTEPPVKGAPVAKSPEQLLADEAAADRKAADTASQDAEKKIQAAKDAETVVNKGTPIYMPLDITDKDGKPLMFTIPDSKKSTPAPSTTPPAATTTCVAPCAGLTCAVTCPPPAAQTASPKTP